MNTKKFEFIRKCKILVLLFLVSFVLSGCLPQLGESDSGGKDEYLKGTAPEGFPSVPLYKNAQIVESYGFGDNFGMSAISKDDVSQIVKFYNDTLPGLGWEVILAQKSTDDYSFSIKNETQQGSVSVNPASDPKMSAISIAVSSRAGAI